MTTSESQVKKKTEPKIDFFLRHLTGHRKGLVERFATDRVSIGRGKNNHCSFDAEKERSVSHRHCEIRIEDGLPIVYDIGSLNGTYVNGRRVRRAPLADGDEMGLGREGPRLRFGFGAGEEAASGASRADGAAELPAVPERVHHIGATAEERQPLSLSDLADPDTKRRRKLLVGGIIAAVIVASAVWFIVRLLDRIESLETRDEGTATGKVIIPSPGGHRTSPDPAARPRVRAPSSIPSGPRGAVSRLVGVVRDDRKRIVDQETLGYGAVVRTDGVVTTEDVYRRIKAWLRRSAIDQRHDKIVLAAPNGSLDGAAQVEARIRHPAANDREDARIVLLLLEDGTRMARVATATPKPGNMRFYAPWEAAQDIELQQLTNAGRGRVRPENATLIGFQSGGELPSPAAGMPLFAGDELVGLSLGYDVAGWAISSIPIKQLLDHAENATAELITSDEK